MVDGFEHALNANMIAIAELRVAPGENANCATAAGVLQLEERVVIALARDSFLHRRRHTPQGDCLPIEVRRPDDKGTDTEFGRMRPGCCRKERQNHCSNEPFASAALHGRGAEIKAPAGAPLKHVARALGILVKTSS